MMDFYGKEISAGDVVKVDKAYFKHQNGYFFVERDADAGLVKKGGVLLHRVSRFGQISDKDGDIFYYPFPASGKQDIDEWNKRFAKIEVVNSVDTKQILAFFEKEADLADFDAKWAIMYNKPDEVVAELQAEAKWLKSVCKKLSAN